MPCSQISSLCIKVIPLAVSLKLFINGLRFAKESMRSFTTYCGFLISIALEWNKMLTQLQKAIQRFEVLEENE